MKLFFVVGSIAYALVVAFWCKFCEQSNLPDVATSESLHRAAVADGGGQWRGYQECEGVDYDLVLFNSPQTGSTLALKTTEITADGVRRRISESDKLFSGN